MRLLCADGFIWNTPRLLKMVWYYAVTDPADPSHVLEALKKGPYGRCVFHCDNTVVDHQTVDIKFENQVTASFLMTAFTRSMCKADPSDGNKGGAEGRHGCRCYRAYRFCKRKSGDRYSFTLLQRDTTEVI